MDPIFKGDYPEDAIAHLGSDAPKVHAAELALIQQPLDFLGVNFYTRGYISTRQPPLQAPGKQGFTDMGWEVVPEAFTDHLVRLKNDYVLPPIYITENGMANADTVVNGRVPDTERIAYVEGHLKALARAVALGVDVRGYFYWSLLDNFEWNSGYTKRFGMFHVNYATQQRLAKDSAHWYKSIIADFKAKRAG
jgi:beta-glucosidase